MSETKPMFKTVSAVFIALTVIFATSTGYLLTNPNTMTQTQTVAVTTTAVASISSPLYSINVAYSPSLGFYLTNSTGWTLYVFKNDIPTNGTSRCTGKCIQNWPAFYISHINLPPGLNATDFTTITRPDGSKQIAYSGWPLYTFINDKKPGDTTGQGVNKVWFACAVPKLKLEA
jgi:predicted lipoprotein with Yx(FWY)xxD motif